MYTFWIKGERKWKRGYQDYETLIKLFADEGLTRHLVISLDKY